ncbi:MAG: phage holin family protein [Myxococcales bacterium]
MARFLESSGVLGRDESSPGRASKMDERAARSPSFAEVVRTAAEELIDLLTAQMKLARAELSADISQRVHRAMRVAVFLPALLGGYVFAMAGLAYWLAQFWGPAGAFLAVAGLQASVGGIGVVWTLHAFRARPVLEHAQAEATTTLHQTIAAISPANSGTKGVTVDA